METVSPITNTGKSYLRFDRHKHEHKQKKQRRNGNEFKNILDGAMGVDLRA